MSSVQAYGWGQLMARHRAAVLIVWLLVAAASAAMIGPLHKAIGATDYTVDGSQSRAAAHLLERRFAEAGSEQDLLVFYSPRHTASEPVFRNTVAKALSITQRSPHVRGVLAPYGLGARGLISRDQHAALALIGMAGGARQLGERGERLQDTLRPLGQGPVQVWLTGYSPLTRSITSVGEEDVERAEMIGVPVALLVLVLAFGPIVAAAIPLLLALAALVFTMGVLYLFSRVLTLDPYVTTIATMLGVGVGIDYAMFIVTRFREALTENDHRRHRAVGTAIATSGRTILFSGGIVAVCLTALFIVRAPVFRDFAIAASSATLCTVLAALTLLPAVLAVLGERINNRVLPAWLTTRGARLATRLLPVRPRTHTRAAGELGLLGRWAQATMRRPLVSAGVVGALLLAAGTPVFGLRTGIDAGFSALAHTPAGKGQQILTREFVPGALAPIQVVLTGPHGAPLPASGQTDAVALQGMLRHDPRVAQSAILKGEGAELVSVVSARPVDSPISEALVRHIREDLVPRLQPHGAIEASVGGATANSVDLSRETRTKFPFVVLAVLGMALIFLIGTFRSLLLPLKAVAMNLLATWATVGVVVLIFQHGYGQHLLGFKSTGFIQNHLPLNVFALLFGLSMDYEVFLIRRMREAWEQTEDNQVAVTTGLERTARPISAAAMIMVAVFGCFIRAHQLEIQEYGFALAIAIAIHATLIRLVLVPSLMRLFGAANWWLPRRPVRAPAVEGTADA